MKWVVIFFLIPFYLGSQLHGEDNNLFDSNKQSSINIEIPNDLNYAPLIPLTPEFPLTVSLLNREKLITNPQRVIAEQQKITQTLQDHTFPWLLTLALLSLGGLSTFIYLLYQQWKKPPFTPESLAIPKDQEIRQKLADLQQQVSQSSLSVANFYQHLTDYAKDLLSFKINQPTAHYTTEEWIKQFPKNLAIDQKQFLSFLITADQVKYAELTPSISEKKQMLDYLENLTNELLPTTVIGDEKVKQTLSK